MAGGPDQDIRGGRPLKLNLDCIPCFQRQALQAIRFVSEDEKVHERVIRDVMKRLLELEWDSTPPGLAREVHALVRRYTGGGDPYRKVKEDSNHEALRLYDEMKAIVEQSDDQIVTAARIAIAGNIIDFGAVQEYDLEETISDVLSREFAIDDSPEFKQRLSRAGSILYFLDNAGEIVFDKLFAETLASNADIEAIDFVVKGGPILNDATMEDAKMVGLDEIPGAAFRKITNGEPGTGPPRLSDEVRSWIAGHDLTISKGQGNYEEMSEYRDIFFLLIAKCPLIASDVSVDIRDIVFKST